MENKPTYPSATKGLLVIEDMEDNHRRNAYAKLCALRDTGREYPVSVLESLRAEIAKRDTANNFVPTPEKKEPSLPSGFVDLLAALAYDVNKLSVFDNLADLKTSLGLVTEKITGQVNKLKETGQTASYFKQVEPVSPLLASTTVLRETAAFQELTSLVNSLETYSVVTLGDLSEISPADFATVRFSTPQAFLDATTLLCSAGLTWNPTSVVLSVDGYINRILNPNVSDITTFVTNAEGRLHKCLVEFDLILNTSRSRNVGLWAVPGFVELLDGIDRIFSGVKRRVSLAASTVGTMLFAQGHTAANAHFGIAKLNNTQAFKHQVTLYLNRVTQRAFRANSPIVDRPVVEDVAPSGASDTCSCGVCAG